MNNLDSILKSRDITFLTKAWIIKVTIFPEVMYQCESWTIRKAECWRIDTFKLWGWRKFLRASWTARRANQSILKEINLFIGRTDAKTPVLWPHDTKSWPLEKTLMLGKTEGRRRRGRQKNEMMRWHHRLNGREFEQTLGDSEGQGSLVCGSPWGHKESDMT